MKKIIKLFVVVTVIMHIITVNQVWAGNGSQVMGIGAASRSLGGTGISYPQSGISALYLNPGGLIYFDQLRVDFDGSIFISIIKSTLAGATGESQAKVFLIPYFGFVLPLSDYVYFGIGAAGIAGFSVDYRTTDLEPILTAGGMPSCVFLQQLDFIPGVGIKLLKGILGVGLSLPVNYQAMEFGNGYSSSFGLSIKSGAVVDIKVAKFGFYFKSPAIVKPRLKRVIPVTNGDIELAAPMEIGIGASFTLVRNLVINLDFKYIFWKLATGYGDDAGKGDMNFDLKNQFVIGCGIQYRIIPMFAIRIGYNYGSKITRQNNPLVPLIINHHLCGGISLNIGKNMEINIGTVISIKAEDGSATGPTGSTEAFLASIDIGVTAKF